MVADGSNMFRKKIQNLAKFADEWIVPEELTSQQILAKISLEFDSFIEIPSRKHHNNLPQK